MSDRDLNEIKLIHLRQPEPSDHFDPRMNWTLRDIEKYLIIPRHRALVLWRFPVLYTQEHNENVHRRT